MPERGRGEEAYEHHLIRSLLDGQYTIREMACSWQAGQSSPDSPDQIRSDQTSLSVTHTCALFRGQNGRERRLFLSPSPNGFRKGARDFSCALSLGLVRRQVERREGSKAVLGPLPPTSGRAMRLAWLLARGGASDLVTS